MGTISNGSGSSFSSISLMGTTRNGSGISFSSASSMAPSCRLEDVKDGVGEVSSSLWELRALSGSEVAMADGLITFSLCLAVWGV